MSPSPMRAAPTQRSGSVSLDAIRAVGEAVRDCRGDADAVFASAGIAAGMLDRDQDSGGLPFDRFVVLINEASRHLARPDFGLHLAVHLGRTSLTGPLSIAMLNATTLGDAFQYCSAHLYTYAEAAQFSVVRDTEAGRWLLSTEFLLDPAIDDRLAIEHALMRTRLMAQTLSAEQVTPKEVWFRHAPIGELAIYERHFGCAVRFDQAYDAVILDLADERIAISSRNDDVYQLATAYIANFFAKPDERISDRVATTLRRHGAVAAASVIEVAAALGMHPRTLQRRLRIEDSRFDQIKDEICRDLALRYLQRTRMPLIRIADALGYSEPSALSRRVMQWFGRSPRDIRRGITLEAR